MTSFNHDTIIFKAKGASRVELPRNATEVVLFVDSADRKLKSVDFAGKITVIGSDATQQATEATYFLKDEIVYKRQPSGLVVEVAKASEIDVSNIEFIGDIIEATIELPGGPKGDKGDPGKDAPDVSPLIKQILQVAKESEETLKKLEVPLVTSGSENVTVTRENNTYAISVDVPEVTKETIIREVSKAGGGGGISKSAVTKIVDEATTTLIPKSFEYNIDGQLVKITDNRNGEVTNFAYNLDGELVTKSNSEGTWTYIYVDGSLVDIQVVKA